MAGPRVGVVLASRGGAEAFGAAIDAASIPHRTGVSTPKPKTTNRRPFTTLTGVRPTE